MERIGSQEAKAAFSQLLARVAGGEQVTITEHGVPVAVMVPPEPSKSLNVADTIETLKRMRKKNTLGGISVRTLIEEGRD